MKVALLTIVVLALAGCAAAVYTGTPQEDPIVYESPRLPECVLLNGGLGMCDVWSVEGVHCVLTYGSQGGGLSCDWSKP